MFESVEKGLCVFSYLTFVPEAHEILWDFRNFVAAEEPN